MKLQEKYKVCCENNTPLENAIDKYIRLKYNGKYMERAEKLAINICKLFEEKYPQVDFEFRYRIKSDVSLKKKLLKLESERLEDLYFLDRISPEQMDYFQEIMLKKYETFTDLNEEEANVKLEKLIKEKETNGEMRKQRSIDNLKEKKRDPMQPDKFLQLFDIIGMKLVVNDVPQGYKTGIQEIDNLIEQRDAESDNKEEYAMLDDRVQDMIVNDFLDNKFLTQENLQELEMHNVESRRKNLNKENGYRAAHSTVRSDDEFNMSYELQGKTKYIESITHEGAADHSKRYGKKRILPEELMNQHDMDRIQKSVPQYYVFRPGMKDLYKCNFIENTYYYYQNEFVKDDKLLEKLWNVEVREQ